MPHLTAELIDLLWAGQPSDECRELAELALLDYLGACIEGGDADATRQLVAALGISNLPLTISMGSRDNGERAQSAALLNGTRGHALEIDDYYVDRYPLGHLASPVIGAALAVAGKNEISGRRLMDSIVMGWEVAGRVHEGIGSAHYGTGFHATGTIGSLGAAAAASYLLYDDPTAAVSALGVAGSLAAGLIASMHSYVKPLHAGNAARNGVLGMLLAKQGYITSEAIIEHPQGFLRVLGDPAPYAEETMLAPLGDWRIKRNCYKIYYTACFDVADITISVAKEHDVDPASVEFVRFGSIRDFSTFQIHADPQNVTAAKLSTQYVAAVSLVDRDCGLEQFTPEKLKDPSIRELMNKVSIQEDERVIQGMEEGHYPISIAIGLGDGSVIEDYKIDTIGFHLNPLQPKDLIAKFRKHAGARIGDAGVDEAVALVDGLSRDENGDGLQGLLEVINQ